MSTADRAASVGPGVKEGRAVDAETAEWLASLRGQEPEEAITRLHDLLLRVARSELSRRNSSRQITGPELDDLAHQAAADAVLHITRRIDDFRGESRFTTWACKFVIFEVSSKLGRHFWTNRRAGGDDLDWDRLPERFGALPAEVAESRELVAAVRAGVENCLTDKQRDVFTAIVVQGIPLDALVLRMDTNRNAIYKLMFDARQKLRQELTARGFIDLREMQ
ncbi:MAG TPA: sigma-70 family RNA polymerase sigma factor [Acidimicrobiales bacterium]